MRLSARHQLECVKHSVTRQKLVWFDLQLLISFQGNSDGKKGKRAVSRIWPQTQFGSLERRGSQADMVSACLYLLCLEFLVSSCTFLLLYCLWNSYSCGLSIFFLIFVAVLRFDSTHPFRIWFPSFLGHLYYCTHSLSPCLPIKPQCSSCKAALLWQFPFWNLAVPSCICLRIVFCRSECTVPICILWKERAGSSLWLAVMKAKGYQWKLVTNWLHLQWKKSWMWQTDSLFSSLLLKCCL